MSRRTAFPRVAIVASLLLPCLALGAPYDYVRNKNTNHVSVIDTANGAVVATQTDTGFVVSLSETRIYVVTRRKVSVIDTVTGAIIADVPPSTGNGIAVNAAGTWIDAATDLLNSVSVIDTATNTAVSHVIVAGPGSVTGAVSPTGTRVYVADGAGNVVIAVDSPADIAPPTVGIEGTPYAIVQSVDPDDGVVAPDLNQHGLTGSWYEPATSGQGLLIDVFPDLIAGQGQVFAGWFTYDAAAGAAERQRWYTLQGPLANGESSAALNIYQNVGGNFNAPPATISDAVGTATLSLSTCSTGNLSYSFTDGSNRAGTIPLIRLLPNVTCSVTAPYRTDADFALSGSWYEGAATSGQGFLAEVAPEAGAIFVAWFTYRPGGESAGAAAQRWYTAQGAFTPGSRTIPLQIYETTGGMFDRPTPARQRTMRVGSGSMAFQSCSAATFTYDFSDGSSAGSSGTIPLVRVGPVPPGCAD